MADLLRRGEGRAGLVSSVSGILTKQAFGLWSSQPPVHGFRFRNVTEAAARETGVCEVVEGYAGPARVAGYTVLHDRSGHLRGIVVADTEPGRRVVAATEDREVAARTESEDFCGRVIDVAGVTFRPGGDPSRPHSPGGALDA